MLLNSFSQERILPTNGHSSNDSLRSPPPDAGGAHTEDLAALAIAGASIVSSLDVDKVLQVIAQQLTNLLDVPICILADWRPNPGIMAHTKFANPKVTRLPKAFKLVSLAEQLELTQVVEKARPIQKQADDPVLTEKERTAFKKAKISTL